MKKIKSIKQLKAEKRSIIQRKQELENKMRKDWKELKDSLKPANFAREAFNNVFRSKTQAQINGQNILKNALVFGVSLLASRLAVKAGVKVGKMLSRKRSLLTSSQ